MKGSFFGERRLTNRVKEIDANRLFDWIDAFIMKAITFAHDLEFFLFELQSLLIEADKH